MELCEDVLLHILKFIPNKSEYLSKFQLVCKDYKQVLQERLDKVYWNEIEKLVFVKGYDLDNNINKMKQGSAFTGELELWNNQIDAKACKHLAPALAKMTTLKKLYLWDNLIDAKACELLAPSLKEMVGLTELWLTDNQIDVKGCEHLIHALQKMTALKELWLGNNRIDATGKEMMREAWKNVGKKRCDLYL